MNAAEAIQAAKATTQRALVERHGGRISLDGKIYDAAVHIGSGTEIVDAGGRLANASIAARVGSAALITKPAPGERIVDVATDIGYEIVSVRRDGDVWLIRGAIFP